MPEPPQKALFCRLFCVSYRGSYFLFVEGWWEGRAVKYLNSFIPFFYIFIAHVCLAFRSMRFIFLCVRAFVLLWYFCLLAIIRSTNLTLPSLTVLFLMDWSLFVLLTLEPSSKIKNWKLKTEKRTPGRCGRWRSRQCSNQWRSTAAKQATNRDHPLRRWKRSRTCHISTPAHPFYRCAISILLLFPAPSRILH